MGLGEVHDVDVVADARAVAGGVVVAEDLRRAALIERTEGHRYQVGHRGVPQRRRSRAGHVEVAQGQPVEPGELAGEADQVLAGQLGPAVGTERNGGSVLGDGRPSAAPYTAALEEKTIRCTSTACMAASSCPSPTTFSR